MQRRVAVFPSWSAIGRVAKESAVAVPEKRRAAQIPSTARAIATVGATVGAAQRTRLAPFPIPLLREREGGWRTSRFLRTQNRPPSCTLPRRCHRSRKSLWKTVGATVRTFRLPFPTSDLFYFHLLHLIIGLFVNKQEAIAHYIER